VGEPAIACRFRAVRSATEPNDLDCEVDESPCAAYKWFGFGKSYEGDAVFHVAFRGDQLAKCSLRGRRVGPLAKRLFQFSSCSGMVLALAGCTCECGYDGVLSADSRVNGVAAAGVCRPAAKLSSAAARYSCAFLRKFLAWFMCSGEDIT
jgi:hypothetical protein